MNISIKCYATLAEYQPDNGNDFPVASNECLFDVVNRLGVESKEVKIAFVNGKYASLNTKLQDGDKVALFPAVGGG